MAWEFIGKFLSDYFLNPYGLLALLSLLPLLLFYLIRPKPRHETIPTLVFFMKDVGQNKVSRLFRRFFTDLLFFIQLLLIVVLSVAVAKPYTNVSQDALVKSNVLLVDVSASTQADGRFSKIIDKAKANLASENTIILVKKTPQLLAEKVSESEASNLLSGLSPTESTTNLDASIRAAEKYLDSGTKLTIVSDFIPTEGEFQITPKLNSLEGEGIVVEKIEVRDPAENIGIIDLLKRGKTRFEVFIKNFKGQAEEITLSIAGSERTVSLEKDETKSVEFDAPKGRGKIEIKEGDNFLPDNTAWTSLPESSDLPVLVITNSDDFSSSILSKNLKKGIPDNFLLQPSVDIAEPPKIPDLSKYEVFIIQDIKPRFLLPGVMRKIKEQVAEEGASLIIMPQKDIFSVDFQGMMPVELVEEMKNVEGGRAELVPESQNVLTNRISFGQVSKYLKVKNKKETRSLITTYDGEPIVSMKNVGDGTVLFYGVFESYSTFPLENTHVVFWKRLLNFLSDTPTSKVLNRETGDILTFDSEKKYKTPSGETERGSMLILDRAGPYVLEDKIVVANLLSEAESDVNSEVVEEKSFGGGAGEEEEKESPLDISKYFIYFGFVVLFFELLYIKFRGDM